MACNNCSKENSYISERLIRNRLIANKKENRVQLIVSANLTTEKGVFFAKDIR